MENHRAPAAQAKQHYATYLENCQKKPMEGLASPTTTANSLSTDHMPGSVLKGFLCNIS